MADEAVMDRERGDGMTGGASDKGAGPERGTPPADRAAVLNSAAALRTVVRYHQQMGIERYPLSPVLAQFLRSGGAQARPAASGGEPGRAAPPERIKAPQPEASGTAASALQALRSEIDACRQCPLATARQGVVHAMGSADALLVVVGDYSDQSTGFAATTLFGATEDTMLWNMMRAIGLSPEQVYVTNAVKCCPLPSDIPGDDSIRCCHGYLLREIELVGPRVVCAMGEIAACSLTGAQGSLFRTRGRFHPCRLARPAGEPLQVMATFHPRFLLKNAELKKAAWQDLQMIQRHLQAR